MRLFDHPLSGNCYKVRLLLALLGLDYETETRELFDGNLQTPEFLHLNPRGQLPVLEDEGEVIWDSLAILVYLARRYGDGTWLPEGALAMARVMQWLAVSENELLYGLARARAIRRFGRPFNAEECQTLGRAGLQLCERRLGEARWLADGAQPSIADVACYPYIALAPEGGLALDDYPAIRAWCARIEALPGYIPLPGSGD